MVATIKSPDAPSAVAFDVAILILCSLAMHDMVTGSISNTEPWRDKYGDRGLTNILIMPDTWVLILGALHGTLFRRSPGAQVAITAYTISMAVIIICFSAYFSNIVVELYNVVSVAVLPLMLVAWHRLGFEPSRIYLRKTAVASLILMAGKITAFMVCMQLWQAHLSQYSLKIHLSSNNDSFPVEVVAVDERLTNSTAFSCDGCRVTDVEMTQQRFVDWLDLYESQGTYQVLLAGLLVMTGLVSYALSMNRPVLGDVHGALNRVFALLCITRVFFVGLMPIYRPWNNFMYVTWLTSSTGLLLLVAGEQWRRFPAAVALCTAAEGMVFVLVKVLYETGLDLNTTIELSILHNLLPVWFVGAALSDRILVRRVARLHLPSHFATAIALGCVYNRWYSYHKWLYGYDGYSFLSDDEWLAWVVILGTFAVLTCGYVALCRILPRLKRRLEDETEYARSLSSWPVL